MPNALLNFPELWVLWNVTQNQGAHFPRCRGCWLLTGIAIFKGSYLALMMNIFIPSLSIPGHCEGTKAKPPCLLQFWKDLQGHSNSKAPVGWSGASTECTLQFSFSLCRPASPHLLQMVFPRTLAGKLPACKSPSQSVSQETQAQIR